MKTVFESELVNHN